VEGGLTNITYLISAWHYDSYDDLRRLFELAGFPTRCFNTLDVSEPGVFITAPLNGDLREHIDSQKGRPRNAHIILWQLERPSGSAGSVGKYAEDNRQAMYERYVDEVWVSDRELADETVLRYVTLGSHPDFGRPGDSKRWDVTHQSYANPRRQNIYKHWEPKRIGPNCWPPARDEVLATTRLGLVTHQDHYPFLEPLRMSLFAAWGLPMLVETVVDAFPYGDDVVEFAPLDQFYPRAEELLKERYGELLKKARKCRQRMTEEYEFGKVVRQAVSESVGEWR